MDRKIVAVDINIATFLNTTHDLAVWKNFFSTVQEKHQLVFISSCWQQTMVYLLDLLSLTNVDVIAESGAIIWFNQTNEFVYQDFLSLSSINIILHQATINNSGIFVMGKNRVFEKPNVSSNYFISLQKYKDFKALWLTDFDQIIKYETFLNNIKKIDISSIYVFSPQTKLDIPFIKTILSDKPNFICNDFYEDNFLFVGSKATKFNALEKYTNNLKLTLKDVYYINLSETPIENSDKLASAFFSNQRLLGLEPLSSKEITNKLRVLSEKLS